MLEPLNAVVPDENTIICGSGCESVSISWVRMGVDLLVRIYNSNAHIGAVALASGCAENGHSSGTVMTVDAHEEGSIVLIAATRIARITKSTVSVAAGVCMENLSRGEREAVLRNVDGAVDILINMLLK
jgi:hypothetical protein